MRHQRIASKREGKKYSEIEDCTFKPELSSRSKKIFERKKNYDSVYERNYLEEFQRLRKKEQKIRQELVQVRQRQPNITSKASSLPRTEPIGDRLYKLAMRSLQEKEKKRVSIDILV
jgi:hypothetical protein